MASHFRRLGDVVIDGKNACEWYQHMGRNLAGTRLEKIQDYVLYKLLNTATPEARALEEGTADEATYYALSDGAGFGLIAEEMAKLPSHLLPRGTLKDILEGPLTPADETKQNSMARNKFVELEVAAYFSRAGFKLLGLMTSSSSLKAWNIKSSANDPSVQEGLIQILGKHTRS